MAAKRPVLQSLDGGAAQREAAAELPLGSDVRACEWMHQRYLAEPASVPEDWRRLFAALEAEAAPARWEPSAAELRLVEVFRRRGFLAADINPLFEPQRRPEDLAVSVGLPPPGPGAPALWDRLCRLYCGTLAIECDTIADDERRDWLYAAFERTGLQSFAREDARILDGLVQAEGFERFVRTKFPGKKTFGLDGAETLIPLLQALLRLAAGAGVDEVVVGGMHRGRLNTLVNVAGKPASRVFAELLGNLEKTNDAAFTGDVPYHVGFSAVQELDGRRLRLSISPHPSHLMTVAAVTLGRARGKQDLRADDQRAAVMPLLLHTDAAFAGQGLTAEILQLSQLAGYSTLGTIHVVVNNQIGFTTDPRDGRSARHCTDIAKMIEAPVLRINGQDPVAAVRAATLALEYRRAFNRDIFLELVCFRRQGHNELDEPRFTQPALYRRIDRAPSVLSAFIAARGEIAAATAAACSQRYAATLEEAYRTGADALARPHGWLDGHWAEVTSAGESDLLQPVITGVDETHLRRLGQALTSPPGIRAHRKVAEVLQRRGQRIERGEGIDWASAEALAFATLLGEGTSVRLSGQDCSRGTFSQRHFRLHDQEDGRSVVPLETVASDRARIEIVDSPLSEYATLAFEHGLSLAHPNRLVVWEAQFGDFVNGAQIVIDQYIAAAEAKWRRLSGLVLLLPHGLEGGGPEHSSARPERFLQLCAEGNIQVVNCSTPANYFHVLRRQVRAPWRKPLVVLSPKLLLRHPGAVSALAELGEGQSFRPVLAREVRGPARRIVLSSGKLAVEIASAAAAADQREVALLRLEQYYPFPARQLEAALAGHAGAEVLWAQEEPMNFGAWSYLEPRLRALCAPLNLQPPVYVGRSCQAAPAGGDNDRFETEQKAIVARCLE